jgi:actin, other eukaryote
MHDFYEPIVIDNGSNKIRFGLSSSDIPREFDCVIGNDLIGCMHNLPKYVDFNYIGNIHRLDSNIFNIRCPIKRGKIHNWQDMVKIWKFIFKELQIEPSNHPLLMTDISPLNDKLKMIDEVFDNLGVPALYLASQSTLSLYSSGLLTGIDINCGYYSTSIVPIFDGHELTHARNNLPIGGKDLSEYLSSILNLRGYSYDCFIPRYRCKIEEIKEKYCFATLDYEKMLKESFAIQYSPTNAYKFRPGIESFIVPEALFKPYPVCLDSVGVVDLLTSSILNSDVDLRPLLCSNVILSGGSSSFPGFAERIMKEIDPKFSVNVYSPPEKLHSAWMGGSMLASSGCMNQKWILKDEYDEYGPNIALRKCI